MFGDFKTPETSEERLGKLENKMLSLLLDRNLLKDEDVTIDELTEVYKLIAEVASNKSQPTVIEIHTTTYKLQKNNWFTTIAYFSIFTLLIAFITTFISDVPCKNSNSPFCKSMRIIPNFITIIFAKPVTDKP